VRKSIVVADGFYKNPRQVRRWALRQRWYYPYDSSAGEPRGESPFKWASTWFTPAEECPFKSSWTLIERLQDLTGDRIDLDHWKAGFPVSEDGTPSPDCADVEPRSCLWNCAFHVKLHPQPLGTGVHNHVTDEWNGVDRNGWAGLIYLSPDAPLDGGLHLWRNVDPEHNFDWMTPPENWERIDSFGNVFNRLILVRGNVPHSGAAGWGNRLQNGRLYQTFFFKVLPSRRVFSLEWTGSGLK